MDGVWKSLYFFCSGEGGGLGVRVPGGGVLRVSREGRGAEA